MAPSGTFFVSSGEPALGLWCETCLLPSKVSIPMYLISESGSTGPFATYEVCVECDPRFAAGGES